MIARLISKPRTNGQITVETELDPKHVRTIKKGLRILKQEKSYKLASSTEGISRAKQWRWNFN